MPKDYSIECAPPYTANADNSRAAEALTNLLKKVGEEEKEASLVLLVDDTSQPDKSFDFDTYGNWLRSEGFSPDLVARESQIVKACDVVLGVIEFSKLDSDLATELQSDNKYNSQLFIASWCLLRLGYIENDEFDSSLQAKQLVNILPESFKPGEDASLEIIRSTPFADAASKIEYIFVPEES